MCDDILHLNVGGVHYTTTRATLCRYPNSMLGAMFNGSMPTTKDTDGYYFIDRDGTLFIHILNYLRSASLALPDNFQHLDPLALEADFFQIEPLIHDIQHIRKKNSPCTSGRLVEVIEVRTGSTATMPTNNSRVKTIISGRCDVISSLPAQFVGPVEKLHHIGDRDFTELELSGSNVRLKLAEYFQHNGWKLMNSDLSSSSGYDAKSMISSLIIEQSYRDRWFMPEDESRVTHDGNGMDQLT
jgi:hypothetical protein